MTQEEMNQVITAAICFGMNNDMSGELHEVKLNNLELAEQLNDKDAETIKLQFKLATEQSINKDLKNELEEVKAELQKKIEEKSEYKLPFYSCQSDRPAHGQLCLCIVPEKIGAVISPVDFMLLKYNDKAKYWDNPEADVDDDSHDDAAYDYGDYKVRYWTPIDVNNIVLVTKCLGEPKE